MKRLDFNKEELDKRRAKCEHKDIDVMVWTNQRVVKWVENIDLEVRNSKC